MVPMVAHATEDNERLLDLRQPAVVMTRLQADA
jgi:hypothetical protein